jgi:Mg2+ and Co2+ transporter CorA
MTQSNIIDSFIDYIRNINSDVDKIEAFFTQKNGNFLSNVKKNGEN